MKKVYLIIIFSLCSIYDFAQNTASPYSLIGIGDIEKSYFDKTSGLGYAGVALISDKSVLLINPASLSFLQNYSYYHNTFYIDVATRYRNVNYSGDAIKSSTNNQSNDVQFKKLTFTIKPKPKWGLSFGLLPYSTSNYSFTGVRRVQGSNETITSAYDGNGSTNLIYLSNSVLLSKKLSIGMQSSLLFGNFKDREIIYSAITDSVLANEKSIFISKLMLKGGIIYKDTINKNWNYAIGATGSLKTNMSANSRIKITDGTTILKSDEEKVDNYFTLPVMFTTGVAIHFKNTYSFVFDYTHQDWSSLNINGLNYSLKNSDRIGFGINYHYFPKQLTDKKKEHFFQLGFYNNNSYLNIYGEKIKEYAFTMGAGVQVSGNLTLQGALEIGSKGTTNMGLIKENFTQFGLTVSYRDFWNSKKIKRYN
ncbi:MAG: hypothetical protein NTZ59_05900 [Bacteroidetes bacterium]|nr:hypothetical protein [Bacteroidota bacterium]